jgi:uncharacterized protein (TIGR03083 family)
MRQRGRLAGMHDGLATRLELLTGIEPGPQVVADALAAQRQRLLALLRTLDDQQWQTTSRCTEWTVHETVRHLVDVLHLSTAKYRHEPAVFEFEVPLDPRTEPRRWLERSAGQSSNETVAAFESAAAAEHDAFARLGSEGGDEQLMGAYGPLHWSVLGAHVFWDGWLHERDIVVPLGLPHESTVAEDRLAALYGLAIASLMSTFMGVPLAMTIELTGAACALYEIDAKDPSATIVRVATDAREADLRADLRAAVDFFAGRGDPSDLETIVDGRSDVAEPLTRLRTVMVPAS